MDKNLFVSHATPIMLTLGTRQVPLMPREFRTGSVGWFGNGATVIDELPVQYTITLVVKGSRDGEGIAAAAALTLPQTTAGGETSQEAQGSIQTPQEGVTPEGLFQTLPEAPQGPESMPRKSKRKPSGQSL